MNVEVGVISPLPPHGEEHAWIDALWRRVDAAMDAAHENAMSVWHLQRVLAKKRDPLTQTLFLDEVVGKSASPQALCDRFWAVFCKGLSEHLSRAHAAAGFVAGALRKGFPRLVGALESVVAKAGETPTPPRARPGARAGTARLARRRCAPSSPSRRLFHAFAHASHRCGEQLFRRWARRRRGERRRVSVADSHGD